MTDISSINAQDAGFFSELAYQGIGTGLNINKPGLTPANFVGWSEITSVQLPSGQFSSLISLFRAAGIGQDVDEGNLDNQFRIFKNGSEIVFAFKGSDATTNWIDDLGGADGNQAYIDLKSTFEVALNYIKSVYPTAQIYTDGHSLGGGLAQTFSLAYQLNGFGQNALPI